jgi:hypothetical protein
MHMMKKNIKVSIQNSKMDRTIVILTNRKRLMKKPMPIDIVYIGIVKMFLAVVTIMCHRDGNLKQ